MSPYLVAEKKKCKQEFEKNLAAVLHDPSKITQAVNARLAVQLDKNSKNDFTSETLGATLVALDQNTKKVQSALLPQNDKGEVITFDNRVLIELKNAGYSDNEITQMKSSDAIVYASAIATAIAVSVANIYEQYYKLLDEKADETELVESVMSDQKEFKKELYGGSRKVIDTVNKKIAAGVEPDENFFSRVQKQSASVKVSAPAVKKSSQAPTVNPKAVETQVAMKKEINATKQLDPSKKENTEPVKPWQYYVTTSKR